LDFAVAGLLLQIFYFHMAMYIHLPAMTAGAMASTADSGLRSGECAAAASELLRRYLLLRNEPSPAFESKTSDFVAFTAATALALSPPATLDAPGVDGSNVLEGALGMFKTQEQADRRQGLHETSLAAQCCKILELLCRRPPPPAEGVPAAEAQEVRIPYFGKVLLRQVTRSEAGPSVPTPSGQSTATTPNIDPSFQQQGFMFGDTDGPALLEFMVGAGGEPGATDHFDIFSTDDLPLWPQAFPPDPSQDWGLWQ
jgi:hypothetical protein